MERFLAPATSIMNRLRYLQKFILVGFMLLLPLGVALTQFISKANYDVAFSAKERLGLEYNIPVYQLLLDLHKHQTLSTAYLDGADLFKQVTAEQDEIAAAITAVDAVNTKLGATLNVSSSWNNIKTQWTTLKDKLLQLSSDEAYLQQSQLNAAVLSLIVEVGNNSNLILDPDIDTYYSMDAVILKLPQLQDYLSQLNGIAVTAPMHILSPSNQTRSVIIAGLVNSTLAANERGWGYAFNRNAALQSTLSPVIATMKTSVGKVLAFALASANSPSTTNAAYSVAQYVTASSDAVQSVSDLTIAASRSLDTLLFNRVSRYENARTATLVVTFVGLLLAIYLLSGFYQSVRTTITSLGDASKRMVSGKFAEEVKIDTKDELGEVTNSFNTVARALVNSNASLQQLNKSLEERQHQLEVANAMAKEANRLKSEFLSTMSHELRTPLNAIVGFTDLLLTGKPGPINDTQKLFLERTAGNNRRLLGLINDILDLSRIEAGRMEIVNMPYNPREMIDFVAAQTSSLFSAKKLQFVTTIDSNLIDSVIGDRSRVEQVVINLLSNAAKFTTTGSVELRVKQVGAESWTITVKDSGKGIPPHMLDAIFEPFRQVDGSTNRQFGGSGLGLAIVRDLCKMMDGNIFVDSDVNKGSTFTVQLPVTISGRDNIAEANKMSGSSSESAAQKVAV